MEAYLGNGLRVFIGLIVILHGAAAITMGHAVAKTWRHWGQAVAYGLLMAAAARYFDFALFQGSLLAPIPYLVAAVLLVALALLSYRITLVDKLAKQYPWIYKKAAFGLAAISVRTGRA